MRDGQAESAENVVDRKGSASLDTVMNPSPRVLMVQRGVDAVLDRIGPAIDLYRPYVDGLGNLPRDGRFLLVGNHTQAGGEALLIPFFVRREIGMRVRPLAERMMANLPGPLGDAFAAYGAVVGSPETARELMLHNEPILVFPGGGRELTKFKGEEHTLRWQGRAGFARVAIEHDYPIVPAALVGGDDVYRSLMTRTSRFGATSVNLSHRLFGRSDMALPLMRGVGPTLIPRPQRMYIRFKEPIGTAKPSRTGHDQWVETVKRKTQQSLEAAIADLVELRRGDPYRELNPLAWSSAAEAREPRQ